MKVLFVVGVLLLVLVFVFLCWLESRWEVEKWFLN